MLPKKSILFGIKEEDSCGVTGLMEIKKHQENLSCCRIKSCDWIAVGNDSYYADENVSTEGNGNMVDLRSWGKTTLL